MGRSRYRVVGEHKSYFVTSSVIHWLPLFASPSLARIVIDSLNFLIQQNRIKIHAWVLMETHLHLVATSADISGEMRKFKSFTARSMIDCLEKNGPEFFLKQLRFFKKRHKEGQTYQIWQEGIHPKAILDEAAFVKTMEYLHFNPVKRGYVDLPEEWRYSTARDYAGKRGLVEIERLE